MAEASRGARPLKETPTSSPLPSKEWISLATSPELEAASYHTFHSPTPGLFSLHPTQPQPTGRSGFRTRPLWVQTTRARHRCISESLGKQRRGAPCSLGTLTYKGMGLPRRGCGLEGQCRCEGGLGVRAETHAPFSLSLCWPHSLRMALWPRSQ